MKLLSLFLFLAFFVAFSQGNSIDLDDGGFNDAIQDGTFLVMFYAPWCGHCKRLKPEFESAASSLRDNDPPVHLAKVDCTEGGKDTCSKFGVSGYPTLKIFKDGELSGDYNGPREAKGIVKFMAGQVGPASKHLTSAEDLDRFLAVDEAVVVAFCSDGSSLQKTYLKMADQLRNDYRFAHTSNDQLVAEHAAGAAAGAVKLFRPKHLHNKMEPSVVDVTADTVDEMKRQINKNKHGLVGHRTTDTAAEFTTPLVVVYYNVDYVKDKKGTNYRRNRVLKVANQFVDRATFAVSRLDDFHQELEEFGITDFTGRDGVRVLARSAANQKFVMTDAFGVDSLKQFVDDFLNDKLTPYVKSEPVPENNDDVPVKVAVAANFDQVVQPTARDTLIEFYAPWCGHCKKLAPIFDELGEKMKNEAGVTIAKMDATANDVPDGYDVRGFPTIYFVAKNKKPTVYQGGRELDDFVKYLAREATDELAGYDRTGKPKKQEL